MADSAKKEKSVRTAKAAGPGFFKGVKVEFKRISWREKDSLIRQSIAVTCVSVVVGVIIAVLDFFMQYGVDFLTSL